MTHFVLTVNQRDSREVGDMVPELLRALHPVDTVIEFQRSVGDEAIGVVSDVHAAVDAALRRAKAGTYRIRCIHGHHGGTVLRDMLRRDYAKHPQVRRIETGLGPGVTDLVLREF